MLPNNNYSVQRLETNNTQLLHRIRLRKFTPQTPIADIFVRESEWQKDDQMPIANDDLHGQSWNTNFGSNPFDDSPSEYSQNTEDTEYTPIQIPDDKRPPSSGSSKNDRGAQWNRPLNRMKIMKMKFRNKPVRMIKIPKKLKKIQITIRI